MRINRCVQLKENHNKVAIDESCEILNDHLKKMSSSSNLDSLVNKSLYISVARRCTQNLGSNNRRQSPKSSGASVPPTRKKISGSNREIVYIYYSFYKSAKEYTRQLAMEFVQYIEGSSEAY